ncbi:hypothetical protein A0H81_04889 [Grifola frondosa]|uniref:CBM21 domain-containing protein n=1 Tax=Grifola frondosa TaxID=5627 RepID=A0A1C7MFX2_GRIFR|nr:hypothetical protein A0H81_04889 [Grifola frondosa]
MSTVVNFKTFTPMDYPFSRHSNSAGAPLPRIPRRTPSSSSRIGNVAQGVATIQSIFSAHQPLFTSSPSTPAKSTLLPAALVVQPPTPPKAEPAAHTLGEPSASSSSSSSESYVHMLAPRARRVRTPKMQPLRAPGDSTPTPAVLEARSMPPTRVAWPAQDNCSPPSGSGGETPRQVTPPGRELLSTPRPASVSHPEAAPFLRKKSGEPLKSSLKSRRAAVRGDLSVVTGTQSSKSEPSTPTHIKSVHFDAQLEHVKLFLAEQKPLAVSRDGSPTDTSGTESDFPEFIFGREREVQRGALVMRVVNMPAGAREDADIALEELVLSADGDERARAGASAKSRVREVGRDGKFDMFAFSIRLNDMLSRIEEKTMFVALRYTVAGREIWDNNDGQNYQVTFSRAKPQPRARPANDPGFASLKSKLEKVVRGEETVGEYMTQQSHKSSSDSGDRFTLEANTSLSARYDFAASLRTPWAGARNPVAHRAQRTSKRDQGLLRPPRIMSPDEGAQSPAYYAGSDLDDTPVPVLSRRRGRNHQRGYFDIGIAHDAGVRKTPTGSPLAAQPNTRFNSLPAMNMSRLSPSPTRGAALSPEPAWYVERGGSEESTPSITSTSESSRSSSPSSSPVDDPLMYNFMRAVTERGERSSPVEMDNYNVFLNKFCFYTGSDSMLDVPSEAIHRSHSASSVEELLSSPNPNYHLSPGETPTRSSSFDDVVSISGTSTPTTSSMVDSESPSPLLTAH